MHREDQPQSWKQLSLPFIPNAGSEGASALRLAYGQLKLSRVLPFEQAMSDRAMAIGIRHLADAIIRRRTLGAGTRIDGTEPAYRPESAPFLVEQGDH